MSTNKVLFVFLFLFSFYSTIFAQEEEQYKYSLKEHLSFNLRGKVFSFVIFEDEYFLTGTLGWEILYNKRHSLGIDATYFRWRYEHDDDKDVAMWENYERRTYWHVDYKFKFLDIKNKQFYLNIYDKIGYYKMWYKPQEYNFINTDTTFLRSKTTGTFNEPGIGIGIRSNFNESRFGWDLSANVAKRFNVNDVLTYDGPPVSSQFIADQKNESILFYMRLNLFYHFN